MRDNVERVKEKADIVSIIGEYVILKRAGKNYKGLCPFHNEKTPSFVVSEQNQNFKCFGCGAHGDVINFIMQRDNMTFPEALEFLADKVGVVLDNTQMARKNKVDTEKYYKINLDVARFYFKNLLTNKKARDYLRERNVNDKSINKFKLGLAKDSWDDLYNYLLQMGHDLKACEELGLIGRNRSGGYYDKYRNRIIYPITDIKNNIIGFGGRTLGADSAKYINSPESSIYHKGNNLYGLDIIHKSNDRQRIILVEGYMDVIGLHQAGETSAVAALGTALTEQQALKISRYGKEIFICYDSDEAGRKATKKAIEIFRSKQLKPKIVELETGLDPDEFIIKYGRDAFESRLKNAQGPIEYLIEKAVDGRNFKNPYELDDLMKELMDILNKIESNVIRDEYIKSISTMIGINEDSLRNDLSKATKKEPQKVNYENKGEKKYNGLVIDAIILSMQDQESYHKLKKYFLSYGDEEIKKLAENIEEKYKSGSKTVLIDMICDTISNLSLLNSIKKGINRIHDKGSLDELITRLEILALNDEKDKLGIEISMLSSLAMENDQYKEVVAEKLLRLSEIDRILKTGRA